MARFYLASFVGSGATREDMFRPPADDYGIIDLRGDPTVQEGFCLLWVPAPITGARLIDLGDDLDGSMPANVSRALEGDLKVSLDAKGTLRQIIPELLLIHGTSSTDKTRWNRIEAGRRGRVRIVLGDEVVYDAPTIRGTTLNETWAGVSDKDDPSGLNFTWVETLNDMDVVSNQLEAMNTSGRVRCQADMASANHRVDATIGTAVSSNTWHEVIARYASAAETMYVYGHQVASGGRELYKEIAGAFTSLSADTSGGPAEEDDVLSIEVDGSDIAGFLNSVSQRTATDGTITTGTRMGLDVFATGTNRGHFKSVIGADLTVTPPAAPTNLAATTFSHSRIDLTWDDNATDETGYRVERSPDGSTDWSNVSGSLPANTESYEDSGLDPETEYFYRVYAFNGGGDSDPSNTDSATTDEAPDVSANDLFLRSAAAKPVSNAEDLRLRSYADKTDTGGEEEEFPVEEASEQDEAGELALTVEPLFSVQAASEVDTAQDVVMAAEPVFTVEAATEEDVAGEVDMAVDTGMSAEEATEEDHAEDTVMVTEPVLTVEAASEVDTAHDVVLQTAPAFDVEGASEEDTAHDVVLTVAEVFTVEAASEVDEAHDVVLAVEQAFTVEPASEEDHAEDVSVGAAVGMEVEPASEEDLAEDILLQAEPLLDVEPATEEDTAHDVVLAVEPVFVVEHAEEEDRASDVDMASVSGFGVEQAYERDTAHEVVLAVEPVFVVEPASEEDTAHEAVMAVEQEFEVEAASEEDHAFDVEMGAVVGINVEAASEVDVAHDVVMVTDLVFPVEPATEVDHAHDVIFVSVVVFVVEPGVEVDRAFDVVMDNSDVIVLASPVCGIEGPHGVVGLVTIGVRHDVTGPEAAGSLTGPGGAAASIGPASTCGIDD